MKKPADVRVAALFLLWVIIADYCGTVLGLAARVPLGWWQFPLAILGAGGLIYLRFKNEWRRGVLAGICIILGAVALSALIPDYSYDGTLYHNEISIRLAEGWNPIYDPLPDTSLWTRHYAKGMELLAATIMGAFGSVETGKGINIILAASALLYLKTALDEWLPRRGNPLKWCIVLFSACNPQALAELTVPYNDLGTYYSLMWGILLLLLWNRRRSRFLLCSLLGITVVAISIKFTCAFHMTLLWLAAIIWTAFHRQWRRAAVLSLWFLAAAVAGFVLLGWHPYVTNLIHAGNPLYPLMGSGQVDIMSYNTPDIYEGHNRFYNFLLSNVPRLYLIGYDTRIDGFGPLFLPVLLLSIFIMACDRRNVPGVAWYIVIVTLASCFVFEQTWWPRYNMQLWLVPVTAIVTAARSRLRERLNKECVYAIMAMGFMAVPLVILFQVKKTVTLIEIQRIYIDAYKGKRVKGLWQGSNTSGGFVYMRRMMQEKGMEVEPVTEEEFDSPYIYYPTGIQAPNFVGLELDESTYRRMMSVKHIPHITEAPKEYAVIR